ncbi:hypothetical protein LTS17_002002 [Exophiala oligosperma]
MYQLLVPIPLPAGTSDYSKRTLEFIRELYFVLCVVDYVLHNYFEEPEIAQLLEAYFSEHGDIETARIHVRIPIANQRYLLALISAVDRVYTIVNKPGRYGRDTDDVSEWASGTSYRFSSTQRVDSDSSKRKPNVVAYCMSNKRITTIFCNHFRDPMYGCAISEMIQVLRLKATPDDIDSIQCLGMTILHEMTHEHLGALDFGLYGYGDSVSFAQRRGKNSEPWPLHADGITLFIISVYLTVLMPLVHFCNTDCGGIVPRGDFGPYGLLPPFDKAKARSGKAMVDIVERLQKDPDFGHLKLRFNIV